MPILGKLAIGVLIVACPMAVQAQTLDQQMQCAAQAKLLVQERDASIKKNYLELLAQNKVQKIESSLSDYSSHFNTSQERCFVLQKGSLTYEGSKASMATQVLIDVYERRVYAKISSYKENWLDVQETPKTWCKIEKVAAYPHRTCSRTRYAIPCASPCADFLKFLEPRSVIDTGPGQGSKPGPAAPTTSRRWEVSKFSGVEGADAYQ